jgi:hypothetical protein
MRLRRKLSQIFEINIISTQRLHMATLPYIRQMRNVPNRLGIINTIDQQFDLSIKGIIVRLCQLDPQS